MSRKVMCKCKPCYEYQSIEFEWELDLDDVNNQQEMCDLYMRIVRFFQKEAPKQSTPQGKKPIQAMATQQQLDYMDSLGIKHPKDCSKAQAGRLIDEYFNKSKGMSGSLV